MYCASHKNVETELSCGKCEKPICFRCLFQTPVGGRCRTCANVRALPMFYVSPALVLRALAASLVAGGAFGAIWGLLITAGYDILFLVLPGLALGYAVSECVGLATNRKSGPPLQAAALIGIAFAYVVRLVMISLSWDIAIIDVLRDDVSGYLTLLVAGFIAVTRLR